LRRALQAQQRLREPALEIVEHHLLDLLRRLADTPAQDFKQPDGDLRLVAHQRKQIPALEHHQRAIGERQRIGGSQMAVEQPGFSENLSRLDEIDHGTLSLGGRNQHLDRAAADREKRTSGVAFHEDGFAARDIPRRRIGRNARTRFAR
jgi:hypothetical protein